MDLDTVAGTHIGLVARSPTWLSEGVLNHSKKSFADAGCAFARVIASVANDSSPGERFWKTFETLLLPRFSLWVIRGRVETIWLMGC
jgi:hypothetical protein